MHARSLQARLISLLAVLALALIVPTTAAMADEDAEGDEGEHDEGPPQVQRVSGPNRFTTAVSLSQLTHPTPEDEGPATEHLYLATGGSFADALTGAPAAAAKRAPTLFAPGGTLTAPVAAEIERLDPTSVTILGGTNAVTPPIARELATLVGEDDVIRHGGDDRYATAAEIARTRYEDGADTVLLATGGRFPDALSGGPLAAVEDAPVLLTTHDELPADTQDALEELDPKTLIALGGPGALGEDVLAAAGEHLGLPDDALLRIGGQDRYETAVLVSRYLTGDWQPGDDEDPDREDEVDTVYVATGVGWADAVVGAGAAGAEGAPALLTNPGDLPDVTAEELERLAPDQVIVLGGPSAITTRVAEQIAGVIDGELVDGDDRGAPGPPDHARDDDPSNAADE